MLSLIFSFWEQERLEYKIGSLSCLICLISISFFVDTKIIHQDLRSTPLVHTSEVHLAVKTFLRAHWPHSFVLLAVLFQLLDHRIPRTKILKRSRQVTKNTITLRRHRHRQRNSSVVGVHRTSHLSHCLLDLRVKTN